MEKNLIFLLLLVYSYCSYSQTTPCSDDVILAKKANWKFGFQVPLENGDVIPKAQQPEIIKRIDRIHQLVLEAYPQGIGTEPWYSRGAGSILDNKQPFSYTYRSGYPFYYCSQSFSSNEDAKDEKLKFMESHYNTILYIYANLLPGALFRGANDNFEINGKQVYAMAAIVRKWKGFDVFRHPGDSPYEMVVVVSRAGKELPYHHVTRKEYLEYQIAGQTKMKQDFLTRENPDAPPLLTPAQEEEKKKKDLAQIEKDLKNNPAWREKAIKEYLANYKSSRQLRDEYFNNITVTFDKEIKKYKDEMSKTSDSLLKSPAVVGGISGAQINAIGSMVFSTEKDGGSTLVCENPDYIKKDLPRYVPQYFVMHLQWWGLNAETTVRRFAAPEYFAKMINEKFPVEKLQEMIDK